MTGPTTAPLRNAAPATVVPGHAPARPTCPRCDKPTGLLLERPSPDAYHPIYRCDGKRNGCGYLWSPRSS